MGAAELEITRALCYEQGSRASGTDVSSVEAASPGRDLNRLIQNLDSELQSPVYEVVQPSASGPSVREGTADLEHTPEDAGGTYKLILG